MPARAKPPGTPPPPGEPLEGVLNFMRLLWGVDHGLQSRSKQMARSIGITGPQRLVVRLASRFPHVSAGQLARLMHVHPSTLTGVLQRLEGRGVLVREQDPSDARRALFRVTAKGRKIDRLRTGTAEAAVSKGLAKVDARDIAAAERVLSAVADALDEP